MEDIVELRLITRNDRFLEACKAKSITLGQLAKMLGCHYGTVSAIVNLRKLAKEQTKIRIAVILEQPIDYLFPEFLEVAIKTGVFHKRQVKLNEPQLISLTEAKKELVYDDAQMIDDIDRKLLVAPINDILEETLTRRERTVIERRFGFGGTAPATLEVIGKDFGVSRDRIRQIESKALRKLRHPTISKVLKGLL